MPASNIDRLESIADVPGIEGELKAIAGGLRSVQEQVQGLNKLELNIKGAKTMKDIADAQAKVNVAQEKTLLLNAKIEEINARVEAQAIKQQQETVKLQALKEKSAAQQILDEQKIQAGIDRTIEKENKVAAAAEKRAAASNSLSSRPIESIPYEINTPQPVDSSRTGDTLSELERDEAAVANGAAAMGQAQLQAAGDIDVAGASVAQYKTELEQLIGTLDENIAAQILNKQEMAQVAAEIKSLDVNSAGYEKRLIELTNRQNQLKLSGKELNATIQQQTIYENTGASALDQLNAKLALLNQAYVKLSITQQESPLGKSLQTEIKTLNASITEQEAILGRNQKKVGGYSNAITEAGGKAFGAIRKIAYVLPGVGIAGIFSVLADGVASLAEELFKTEKALDRVKAAQDTLNTAFGDAGYKDAIKNVRELTTYVDLAKQGFLNKKDVLDQYNKVLGNTIGKADSLNEAEQLLVKNGQAYIQVTLLKAAANVALNEAAQLAVDLAKDESKKNIVDKAIDEDKLKRTIEQSDKYKELNQQVKEAYGISIVEGGKAQEALQAYYDEQLKFLVGGKKAQNKKTLEDIATDFQTQAAKLATQFNIDLFGNKDKKDPSNKEAENAKKKQIEDDRKAALDIAKNELEIQADVQKQIVETESFGFSARIDALRKYVAAKQQIIDISAKSEKEKAGLSQIQIEKIDSDAHKASVALQEESSKLFKNAVDKDVKAADDGAYDREQIAKELTENLVASTEVWLKANIAAYDKDKKKADEIAKEKKELEGELAKELIKLAATVLTANIERQKNALQAQIDTLDKRTQAEIEAVRVSTDVTLQTAEQKAAATSLIEARSAAQKAQLEKKQKDLDYKKAQFEKAESIAEIIQKTAVAVVGSLDKPALIPLIIAIGAVQLATVAAQPIPRYKSGVRSAPGGLAYVGDGGKSEGIKTPDGRLYKTAATETLVDLPAGSEVIPDFNKLMLNASMSTIPEFKKGAFSDSGIVSSVKRMEKNVVKAIKNQPQMIIKTPTRWSQYIKQGNTFIEYLNKNL